VSVRQLLCTEPHPLVLQSGLNYEAGPTSYTLAINVSGTLSVTVYAFISVTDVNEAPNPDSYNITVFENATINTVGLQTSVDRGRDVCVAVRVHMSGCGTDDHASVPWYVALRFVSQVVLGFIMGRDPDTGTVLTYSFQDGNQVCVSHMLPDVALVPPR